MEHSRSSAPAKLTALRDRAGLTMQEMALALGYAGRSSIQRYESEGEYTKAWLPREFVDKLVPILVGRGDPPITKAEVLRLAGWTPDLLLGVGETAHAPEVEGIMPVLGEVRAGRWLEVDEMAQERHKPIPVGNDPDYADKPQFALKVLGTSMNRVFDEGDYVIVASDRNHQPQADDLLVVHRVRHGLIEATVKRVRFNDGKVELWPESTDPRWQLPIEYDPEEVEIVGLVIGKYRKIGGR